MRTRRSLPCNLGSDGCCQGLSAFSMWINVLSMTCFISLGPHNSHNTQFTDKETEDHRVKVLCSALATWPMMELEYKSNAWDVSFSRGRHLGWLSLLLPRFSQFPLSTEFFHWHSLPCFQLRPRNSSFPFILRNLPHYTWSFSKAPGTLSLYVLTLILLSAPNVFLPLSQWALTHSSSFILNNMFFVLSQHPILPLY